MNHEMMGDLPGHIFPGLAFLAWAVVWCMALLRRGGNAVARPWDAAPDDVLASDAAATAAWESWAKILIPLVEMAGELRWVTWPMTEVSTTIFAHITADVVIMLSGVTDRLMARGRLPAGSDRITLAFAFLIPAVLFGTHGQHGPVASAAHGLFAQTLFAAAALVLVEHVRPAPLFRWCRVYAVALAGAWFVHTGWLLYRSGYDLMSDALVPRTYLFFTWYALVLAVLVGGAVAARRRTAPPARRPE